MNFKKTLLALTVGLAAANVQAAGFQLHETSISGLGRAFAGEGVVADDATVLARNPAAMALFDKKALSMGFTYIDPGVDIKGTDAPDILGSDFDLSSLHDDGVVPAAVVPFAYFINPVNDKFAYGVGLNVNYGLASEYDNDYAAGSIAGKTDLFSLNFNASGSYRINDNWSVGLGLNVVYAEAELSRRYGAVLENGISMPGPGGIQIPVVPAIPAYTKLMDMEGDDTAWGWNTGVVYELNENHRWSLTYRSEVEIDFDGDIKEPAPLEGAGSLKIDLPAIAEFSGHHQVTNDWGVHYSVMHTDWDSFQELEGFADGMEDPFFVKHENFESTLRFALGATYNYSNDLTLRAGVAFDESAAQEDYRSISIPDSDRLWFSAGATYALDAESSIDFGFSFVDGDEVDVVEQDAILEGLLHEAPQLAPLIGDANWGFESEGNAILVGLQYNRTF